MMKRNLLAALAAASVLAGFGGEKAPPLNILADLLQVDPATKSLVASGNVSAVHAPFRLLSDSCSRDRDGTYRFGAGTLFTTCTNEIGHLHWHVRGGFEYRDGDYVRVRDGWVNFWELPIFWLPYLYSPLYSEEGLQIMPGYVGCWGAFLMTKYSYHLAGTRAKEDPEGWGLDGNTRFDLRWRQGVAFGETLKWRLGEYGQGQFKVYYAWDRNVDDSPVAGYGQYDSYSANWGSSVPRDRYGIELTHVWDVTERDRLRLAAAVFSDSYFRQEFMRNSMFMLKNQFLGYDANELAWEHVETWSGTGVSVSGPLNDFVGGTARLPEIYFDVSPLPVFGLPVNYETENRLGFLRRTPAYYGNDGAPLSAFNCAPGTWSKYETFRFDTYHRLTAPMKFDDWLSVVPRLAYRGTYWGNSAKWGNDGWDALSGWNGAKSVSKGAFRSILEGGVTFAARGTADLGEGWSHTVEPYLDVLAQKAWYAGLDGGRRTYVFDALDASLDWSDQFASRGRNLPYSWYGATPGVRNTLDLADEKGNVRRVFDIDAYAALQFNEASWMGMDDGHRLADRDSPNYGKRGITPVPGFKFAWHPDADTALSGRFEYDCDHNAVAIGDIAWSHRLDDRFQYYARVMSADYRRWDFSSSPYDAETMSEDSLNFLRYTYVQAGFEHELCDAIAWSPYVRWDCREGELDSVGGWIDFRTDCLGFRVLIEYDNDFTYIDGTEREEDFSVGFFIYLRAFGADAGNLMRQ